MIVNGQQQQHIAIADRALQYGDGCFTTMAFRNARLEFFGSHINRLKLACKTLHIDFDKWIELECCIFNVLKTADDCVVKVIITRGVGGRGYSPAYYPITLPFLANPRYQANHQFHHVSLSTFTCRY
jgi:4-amino-4-deoxychorismate lyase